MTAALAIRAKKEEGESLRQPACGWVRKILHMGKAALFKYKDKKILSLAVKWSKLDDL